MRPAHYGYKQYMPIESGLRLVTDQGIKHNDLVFAIWRQDKKTMAHMNCKISIGLFVPSDCTANPYFHLHPKLYFDDNQLQPFKSQSFVVYYKDLLSLEKLKESEEVEHNIAEYFGTPQQKVLVVGHNNPNLDQIIQIFEQGPKLPLAPEPILSEGSCEEVQPTIDDFFLKTQIYLMTQYELPEFRFNIKLGQLHYSRTESDESVNYLLCADIPVAGVLQTRTDLNYPLFTFFRDLRGFEKFRKHIISPKVPK